MEGSSGIASRFSSEKDIQSAAERRKEEWTKAYERMGQKPPEEGPPEKYDPRSLFEKLQEQKDMKQAAFDEKYNIRNQFRALDEDETSFLGSILDDKWIEEKERKAEIDAELAKFRQAVSEKQALPEGSPPAGSPPLPSTSGSPPAAAATSTAALKPPPPKAKKSGFQQKGLLAGAIKRKSSGGEKDKKKLAPVVAKEGQAKTTATHSSSKDVPVDSKAEDEAGPAESAAKKRKVAD